MGGHRTGHDKGDKQRATVAKPPPLPPPKKKEKATTHLERGEPRIRRTRPWKCIGEYSSFLLPFPNIHNLRTQQHLWIRLAVASVPGVPTHGPRHTHTHTVTRTSSGQGSTSISPSAAETHACRGPKPSLRRCTQACMQCTSPKSASPLATNPDTGQGNAADFRCCCKTALKAGPLERLACTAADQRTKHTHTSTSTQ